MKAERYRAEGLGQSVSRSSRCAPATLGRRKLNIDRHDNGGDDAPKRLGDDEELARNVKLS